MVGHIVGLGNRHGENILFDSTTAFMLISVAYSMKVCYWRSPSWCLSGFTQVRNAKACVFRILEDNANTLTNFEVLDFLRSTGASKDAARVVAQIAQSDLQVKAEEVTTSVGNPVASNDALLIYYYNNYDH
ncbi:hypothetical protein Dsin_003958 [Dipteronia sinensis]|uniref:Uncharacterized protein n=1 Tax=Dipteronia sinensis TaxID=43782 RepID=A0AAE0BA51_9ROSI|nr:hypothetical protein Dsin_003958 [Dipteronia sinensis]